MGKPKQKYYVIWEGTETGVFSSWTEVLLRTKGFPGAKYKSFPTLEMAKSAFKDSYRDHFDYSSDGGKSPKKEPAKKPPVDLYRPAWAVDAACSGVPGPVEYRGLDLESGFQLFHQGPFKQGTNNIGEFLAIVHALALLDKKGDQVTAVYTDSRTAMAWVRLKKAKTTLARTKINAPLFELVDRAELWLKTHSPKNKIIKWETDLWGEIPADFGRKR